MFVDILPPSLVLTAYSRYIYTTKTFIFVLTFQNVYLNNAAVVDLGSIRWNGQLSGLNYTIQKLKVYLRSL